MPKKKHQRLEPKPDGIETDLVRLKALALRNEEAHFQLRTTLKQSPMSSSKIDRFFHQANAAVSAAVDCTLCANCCVVSSPVLEQSDVDRLALKLGMPPEQVQERYLREEEDGALVFAAQPCPFLENKRCTVYDDRPSDCRAFPHLDKKDMVSRLLAVIDNAQTCPIVYEVLERVRRVR